MSVLKIRKYPDPILKSKCEPVQCVEEQERKLFADMVQTLQNAEGVGLAAPQIGVNRQLIIANVGEKLVKLANPKIIQMDGWDIQEEGCLSVPGTYVNVKRARLVKVAGLDENGNQVKLDVDGMLARVIQHEIDHLGGVLIIDYLNFLKRLIALTRLRRVKGEGVKND